MDECVNIRTAMLALATAAFGVVLAGCQGSVTVDMASDAPADTEISAVRVEVSGLEFKRSDETTEKLEFTQAEAADLMQLVQVQNSVRLFTAESVPEGSYVGVRLLLATDQDASVSRFDGTQYDLKINEGEYAPIDFTVEEDKSSTESLSLTLDLRKSLSFNDDDNEYTLVPALRSAVTDEAAQVTGFVNATCPVGTSLAQGGAVYLYQGEDIEPDDIGSEVQPYATSAVGDDSFSGTLGYSLRFLPEGDYTIALTCRGDEDEIDSDDDIDFVATAQIHLDKTEAVTHKFGE
jgi:hypothetical protein